MLLLLLPLLRAPLRPAAAVLPERRHHRGAQLEFPRVPQPALVALLQLVQELHAAGKDVLRMDGCVVQMLSAGD
jgi:hypothetical protein